jgi:hypothetical protein
VQWRCDAVQIGKFEFAMFLRWRDVSTGEARWRMETLEGRLPVTPYMLVKLLHINW